MPRRKGFVLIEILLVLSVAGVMAGALCLRLAGGADDTSVVRGEAEELAQWLSNRMTRARLEGTSFKIVALRTAGDKSVRALQLTPYDAGAEDAELYSAEKAVLDIENASQVYTYNCAWHTLTPAVTINLKSRKNPAEVLYSVVVSGQGFVSVKRQNGLAVGGV